MHQFQKDKSCRISIRILPEIMISTLSIFQRKFTISYWLNQNPIAPSCTNQSMKETIYISVGHDIEQDITSISQLSWRLPTSSNKIELHEIQLPTRCLSLADGWFTLLSIFLSMFVSLKHHTKLFQCFNMHGRIFDSFNSYPQKPKGQEHLFHSSNACRQVWTIGFSFNRPTILVFVLTFLYYY